METLLRIEDLTVVYAVPGGWRDAVREVSLTLLAGQRYGIVGESGSGKSTLALALLRAPDTGATIRHGQVALRGRDLATFSAHDLRVAWADDLRLVPQNPLAALNPSLTIGAQLSEALDPRLPRAAAREQVLDLLRQVRMADPQRVFAAYPHELSGGMQQRVMIALALRGTPRLLVLDEPTTALDVTTEAAILDLLVELTSERNAAAILVSHNLAVVAGFCDRVAVLYAGELVEDAPAQTLFQRPLHPYTQGLLDSLPRPGDRRDARQLRPIPGTIPLLTALPPGCIFAPRCPLALDQCHRERPALKETPDGRKVRCWRWQEIADGSLSAHPPSSVQTSPPPMTEQVVLRIADLEKHFAIRRSLPELLKGAPERSVRAVDGVNLQIGHGQTLGVVGESGSGKTTLARCVIGLNERSDGQIELLDLPLAPALADRAPELLKRIQMVFQNPEEALNPYLTIGEALRRPLLRLASLSRTQAEHRVKRLLELVKLPADYAQRLPGQLSGGEKQRVAIARAFAAEPDLVLLDEAVSALDVSVQAAILNLLSDLQRTSGVSYLFITHDLGVVSYLADRIAVVYLGTVVEQGPTAAVLVPPFHPYTEALIAAAPTLHTSGQARIHLEGEVPSPAAVPSGCRFHTRCLRMLGAICQTETPPWRDAGAGHLIQCHIPLDDLRTLQKAPA
jgi:peptide/nickel transport system ATP-binding protein